MRSLIARSAHFESAGQILAAKAIGKNTAIKATEASRMLSTNQTKIAAKAKTKPTKRKGIKSGTESAAPPIVTAELPKKPCISALVSRGAIAGGGGGSEAASAGAAGARSVGGDGGEVAGAAYAGAGMGAAPGETFGSMSDQGARATGLAVGQAAAREGASPQQAAALAADATTQAQGGAPGTTSALGAQVGAQAATSTAADRSNPGAGRLGRVGGALIGGPLGYAAVRGIGNARRRNQTAELEGRWR